MKHFRSVNHYNLNNTNNHNQYFIDILVDYMKSNYLQDKCEYTSIQKLNRNKDIFGYMNSNYQNIDYCSNSGTSEKLSTEFYSRNQVMVVDKRLYSSYAERLIYGHEPVGPDSILFNYKQPVTIYIDYKVNFLNQLKY